MLKKLISHTLIYGLAPQLPKIASLFILPIITKDLTTKDYGIAGLVEAYTGALGAIGGLGLPVVLSNYFIKARTRYKGFWKEIHGILSVWSIAYTFLLALFLYCILPSEANEHLYTIIFLNCLPPLLFNTTNIIGNYYYQLEQKPLVIGIISATSGFVAVFMNLFTISYLKMGYLGWFISSATAVLVTFLFYVYPVYFKHDLSPNFKFKLKRVKKYLKISLPTIPHYYSSYLLDSADRVILGYYKVNINSLGLYNVGYNFGNYIRFLVMAINQAVSPFYLRYYAKGTTSSQYAARDLTFLLQGGVLFICSILALWLKEIFQILISNKELQKGYVVGILIIMAYSYRPMYVGAVNKLFYHEKTSQLWKISFIAGITNLVLNLIFIPIYGIYAAAVTTFLSLLYMGFSAYFLNVFKKIEDVKYYPLRWMLIILFLSTTVFILKDINVRFKITITILFACFISLLLYKLYRELNKENI
ncbi:oligosaccharide flippase family protein [Adhaeribacter swui]|uniref:Oligosaccharide flippase family protein n=1 Tax=Adhaeribacter swui TaxID=2086471 RepID=A0A7G7G9H8_9BACT|nr:oligosaccharide flippase family protein [Adhaeribacter swui]QNF33812.1 oligosaccharide flippase family protein [Adhaeribacter swui]